MKRLITVVLLMTFISFNTFSQDDWIMDFPRVGQVSHSVESRAAAGQNSARVNERPVQPPVAEPV